MDTFKHDRNPADNPALRALEEKLSFQQRQLDELNAVILEQQAELDQQRSELSRLIEVLRSMMGRVGDDLPHERPPHY